MFDVWELSEFSLQGNRGGFFFLKGKSSDDLPGDGVKHRSAYFWSRILCSFDKYVSCALLVDCILSGWSVVEALSISQVPETSDLFPGVQRDVVWVLEYSDLYTVLQDSER